MRATSLLRHSSWDAVLVALALGHGALLLVAPSALLVALGLWWNANTISHNFLHLPFFRSRRMNAAFSAYLTLLLGFPQHLWRARHLAHHAGRDGVRQPWTRAIAVEAGLVALLWTVIATLAPKAFVFVYLPGYAAGLALSALQGHFEHVRGTTSHYGRLYNVLFFNDGFHVEHHARPGDHWTRLPWRPRRDPLSSRWPPVLRWLEWMTTVRPRRGSVPPPFLDALECVVLRSHTLQRFVLDRHEAAFRVCLSGLPAARRVTVIGGGLYPRTALILRRLLPDAELTIIDSNARHLQIARRFLGDEVSTIASWYDATTEFNADLVVVPLAFVGDRAEFYRRPPAATVLVHDWVWAKRGDGVRISWCLLKRLNLVRRPAADAVYERLSA